MSAEPLLLAIDTSCDDTSVAVLRGDCVLSSIVSSQIDVHKEWGGVVPNLAARAHEEMIDGCVATALKRARVSFEDLQAVAVTVGPGLSPALGVGITKARELALELGVPFVPVNHMEGHALSSLLRNRNGNAYSKIDVDVKIDDPPQLFPFLAVCVSGGHTEWVWLRAYGDYEVLGRTLDDAAGEAFDKIARMLELGYPGGPVLAELAEQGDRSAVELPRPMQHTDDYNVSFSGLKTASMKAVTELREQHGDAFATQIPNMCASFQEAVVDTIGIKVERLLEVQQEAGELPTCVLLGGGVSANLRLRSSLRARVRRFGLKVYAPGPSFSTDNAAMIGLAGFRAFERGEMLTDASAIQSVDRLPSWRLSSSWREAHSRSYS